MFIDAIAQVSSLIPIRNEYAPCYNFISLMTDQYQPSVPSNLDAFERELREAWSAAIAGLALA